MSSAGFSTGIVKKLATKDGWAAGKSTTDSRSSWLIYMEVVGLFWLVGIVSCLPGVMSRYVGCRGTREMGSSSTNWMTSGLAGAAAILRTATWWITSGGPGTSGVQYTGRRHRWKIRGKENERGRKLFKESESDWEKVKVHNLFGTLPLILRDTTEFASRVIQEQINTNNYEISQNQGYKT